MLGRALGLDLHVDDLPVEIDPHILCLASKHDVVGQHLFTLKPHFKARIRQTLRAVTGLAERQQYRALGEFAIQRLALHHHL